MVPWREVWEARTTWSQENAGGSTKQPAVKGRRGLTQREVRMWRSTCFAILSDQITAKRTDILPAVRGWDTEWQWQMEKCLEVSQCTVWQSLQSLVRCLPHCTWYMFSVSTKNVCSRRCGNQNSREFRTALTERVNPTTTFCYGCPSCYYNQTPDNKHLQRRFLLVQSITVHFAGESLWQQECEAFDHNASVVLKQRETNAAIQLPVSCLFNKKPEPIGWYCPNSELVFPPRSTLSEMPPQTITPRALSLSWA